MIQLDSTFVNDYREESKNTHPYPSLQWCILLLTTILKKQRSQNTGNVMREKPIKHSLMGFSHEQHKKLLYDRVLHVFWAYLTHMV